MSEKTVATSVETARGTGPDLDSLAALDGSKFWVLTEVATQVFGVRYCAFVLADKTGLWFRAPQGFADDVASREGPLWDAAMAADEPLVISDVLADPRFADESNMIGGVPVRFFASCAFHGPDGQRIGVFCAADPEPMEFDAIKTQALSAIVMYTDGQLAAVKELARASEVQRALLPKRVPPLEGYQVAGACVPARAVGGDFFDWYAIEGGMAITLADVMGKGVGPGIIAATVRATLRTARRDEDVLLAVERAAKTLTQDLEEAGSFVTLFHARLRSADGHISFVDAGHGLTVLVEGDGTAHRLSSTDLPLGAPFGGGWRHQEIVLEEGATLVSFSDGVLDLYDGSLDSVDRVAEIVRQASSAQEIVDEVERLARRDAAPDDVTIVAIKRTGA